MNQGAISGRRHSAIAAVVASVLMLAGYSAVANAGCGDLAGLVPHATAAVFHDDGGQFLLANHSSGPVRPDPVSIVGLWSVTLFGFLQGVDDHAIITWHADGTELMNSSKPPSTGNFCMGVWQQTGRRTYELNHFALEYPTVINIHEHVVLDATGDHYTGTYSVDLLDANDLSAAPIATAVASGNMQATRLTVF